MTRNNDNDPNQYPGQSYLDDAEAVACVIVFAPPSRHGPLQTGPKAGASSTHSAHQCAWFPFLYMAMVCT